MKPPEHGFCGAPIASVIFRVHLTRLAMVLEASVAESFPVTRESRR